jgi:hypothetical protein
VSAAGNVLTLMLPASPADGLYAVALPASAAVDIAGNHPAADAHFAFLFVAAGHTLALPTGGSLYATDQLSIDATGVLDVRNDPLLIHNGNGASITDLVATGRNGGAWNGHGIVTSSATGDFTTLGVAPAPADPSSVLVKYTYGGDANLDGKINVDDYGKIDFNVQLGTAGWINGDFNYDGKVNVDDYGIIDFNVGIQGPPLGGVANPAASAAAAAAFPPASWDAFSTRDREDNYVDGLV